MNYFTELDTFFEKKIIFHTLYKIFYLQNRNYIYSDTNIVLRDKIIRNRYKSIHEIIYKNNRPTIKKLSSCSFKQKMIHHLTYFYLNEININEKEIIYLIKGDLSFLYKSFELLKKTQSITINECRIIYELIEKISNLIKADIKIC